MQCRKGCRSPRRFPALLPGPAWAAGQDVHRKGTEVRAARARVGQPAVLHQLAARGQSRSRKHPGRGLDAGAARAVHPGGGPGSGRSARATAAPPTFLGGYYGRRLAAHRDAVAGLGRTSSRSATFTPRRSQRDVAAAGRRRPPSARRPPRAWPRIVNTCGLARASARIVCSSCLQTCVSCRPFAQYGNPAHGPLPHSAHAFVWKHVNPTGSLTVGMGSHPDLGPAAGGSRAA